MLVIWLVQYLCGRTLKMVLYITSIPTAPPAVDQLGTNVVCRCYIPFSTLYILCCDFDHTLMIVILIFEFTR